MIGKLLKGGGIKKRLIITCVLLSIVPMVVMGYISYYESSSMLLEQTLGEMRSLTEKAVENLENQFTIYRMQMNHLLLPFKMVMDMIQVGMEIDQGNKESLTNELSKFQRDYPYYVKVRLFDATGNEKFAYPTGQGPGQNEGGSPWFQRALASQEVVFSEMLLTKDVPEPVVIMTKTVFDQTGKASCVLAVYISGKGVMGSIDKIKVGREGYAYVVNKDGFVIAYPDKAKILQLNLTSYPFGKEMLQKKRGMVEYTWEGAEKIASFTEYPAMQWIVAASVKKSDILSTVNRMQNIFYLLAVVMAAISFAVAVFISLRIVKPINHAISGLTESSYQVAAAAKQLSTASSSLSEGASRQAAGLEEASSSLEEMSSMTKLNAENSRQANLMMEETGRIVEEANDAMGELNVSMGEITAASEKTAKIIKTIDEIAFQTNLLALNAAVEAARAGEAGAGFAVVAEEVRNLAMRAAEAAKNTENLIAETVGKIKAGTAIVTKSNEAFGKVMEGAKKVGSLIGEIAAASQEQAQGIEQIAKAVTEVDKVVQANAASAEESASAAEEMTAQAERMKDFVGELVALVGGTNNLIAPDSAPRQKKIGVATKRAPLERPTGLITNKTMLSPKPKVISPEEVIPLEEDDFKDF